MSHFEFEFINEYGHTAMQTERKIEEKKTASTVDSIGKTAETRLLANLVVDSHVGDDLSASNASWSFGGQTPNNFANHVQRSVPMYEEGHKLVCELSDYFVQDETACYELGSSVGDLISKIARRHKSHRNARWVGIDNIEAMTIKARERHGDEGIEFVTADILRYEFERVSLFLSYYTIQFTPLATRDQLLRKLYDSLLPGGGLLMFEKVRGDDSIAQDIYSSLYIDFKLEQGFNPSEIIAKAKSLKGILNPRRAIDNETALTNAGFSSVFPVLRYLNFVGYLAIK